MLCHSVIFFVSDQDVSPWNGVKWATPKPKKKLTAMLVKWFFFLWHWNEAAIICKSGVYRVGNDMDVFGLSGKTSLHSDQQIFQMTRNDSMCDLSSILMICWQMVFRGIAKPMSISIGHFLTSIQNGKMLNVTESVS